jgi:hypothetical protein
MVDSFCIAAIVTGFDDPVAAPPHRRDGLFAVIARYRRYLIWKQGRAMVSPIKPGRKPDCGRWSRDRDRASLGVIQLEKHGLTKDVQLMSTATDRITR